MFSSTHTTKLVLDGIGLFLVLAGVMLAIFSRRRKDNQATLLPSTANTSCLVAYYAAGHHLLNTGHGVTDGIHYGMYMTTAADKTSHVLTEDVAIVYVLDLPFNTQAHLLGVSKLYNLNRPQFESFLNTNGLRKVTLENDTSQYFDLYSPEGMDFQLRYVLDPAAQAIVEKYCKNQFWELHDSELYFIVTDDGIGNSNIIEASHQFANAIAPALSTGSNTTAPIVHREVPYDIYDGPMLDCPVCRQKMELRDTKWFRCPNEHGVLVIERELQRLSNHSLIAQVNPTQTVHHGPLACPHCPFTMGPLLYQNGKIEIYACTNCAFYWLDADRVAQLTTRKRLFGIILR